MSPAKLQFRPPPPEPPYGSSLPHSQNAAFIQAYLRLSAFCEVEDTKIPRFPAATPGGKMRIVKLNAWHTVELEDVPSKGLEF